MRPLPSPTNPSRPAQPLEPKLPATHHEGLRRSPQTALPLQSHHAEFHEPDPCAGHPRLRAVSGRAGNDGQVRIIGGQWRNTRLPVPTLPGLRPSSDRVRETLFNWLMPRLGGARVLDVFAGSGALGLEAVSRGAAHATLVERDPQLVANLTAVVTRLKAEARVQVVQADALRWLQTAAPVQASIAFVDPPFAAGLWDSTLALLPRHLSADAWLYLESPEGQAPALPADWLLHREGGTREVRFALYRRATATL
jgi:16S rRNA (guanine966-N2)-methyltransferase